jgi:hypothetical protein
MLYEQLVEFQKKNGHCIVKRGGPGEDNKPLANWVARQRVKQADHKMKMREDRKQLLDKIGFAWTVGFAWKVTQDEMKWKQKYAKLVDFKRKNGHCRVLSRSKDRALGQWVAKQRHFYTNDALAQDRKDLLHKVGFDWKVDRVPIDVSRAGEWESLWNMQYEKLVEYKQKKGDCLVPVVYKEDTSLSIWVWNQRRRVGKMRPDRKELLNKLEFVWKPDNLVAGPVAGHSTNEVRGFFLELSHPLGRSCCSLASPRSFPAFNLCRIQIWIRIRIPSRKRPPAMWVSQMKH